MKVDRTNFKTVPPAELAEGLSSGAFELVETGIAGLVEIVKYVSQAVGQRKRLKMRIEALENFAQAQIKLNEKIEQYLNQPQ